jgi:hypothetical protein
MDIVRGEIISYSSRLCHIYHLLPGVKATKGFVTALHAVFDRDDRAEKLLFTRSEHR